MQVLVAMSTAHKLLEASRRKLACGQRNLLRAGVT